MRILTDYGHRELKIYDTYDRKQAYHSTKNFIRGILFEAIVTSYKVFYAENNERNALDFYLNECL
jgi:hypothetical protein